MRGICSPLRDSSSNPELRHLLEVAALDDIASVPFMDNELFVLIRMLEQQHGREEMGEPSSGDVERPDGAISEDPASSLESVLTSQAYRILAEQSMDEGLAQEAANYFDEAYSEGSGHLPGRCPPVESLCFTDRRQRGFCHLCVVW